MLLEALASLFVTLAPAADISCEDGTDCFCDCVQNDYSGGVINTGNDVVIGSDTYANNACVNRGTKIQPHAVWCGDWEADILHKDAGFEVDQEYFNAGGQSVGWPVWSDQGANPGNRGHNFAALPFAFGMGDSSASDPGTVGACAWTDGDPTPPVNRGPQCAWSPGQCGPMVYSWNLATANAWQSNEGDTDHACIGVMQSSEIANEVSSIQPITNGRSPASSVFDGNQMLAHRIEVATPNGYVTEIPLDDLTPDTTDIGITMAIALPSNAISSGVLDKPWKPNEWRGKNNACGASGRANNLLSGYTGRLERYPFDSMTVWYSTTCGGPTGKYISHDAGEYKYESQSLKFYPSPSYDFGADIGLSKWFCMRAYVEDLDTTNARIRGWVDDVLLIDGRFDPRASDQEGGTAIVKVNSFSNMNDDSPPGETPTSETTYRFEDNMVITAGLPPTCDQLGFQTTPPPDTPTIPFTTNFNDPPEAPLSERGVWVNNATEWTLPVKSGGIAYGTHCNDQCDGSPCYNDSVMHLEGFADDHSITGVAYKTGSFSQNQEIELFLRASSQSTPTESYKGYEVLLPVDGGQDIQLIRWNGPRGDFSFVARKSYSAGVQDGDVIKATISGTDPVTVVLYINDLGNDLVTWTDNDPAKHISGQPGIGYYSRDSSCEQNSRFGWSQITADNL